MTGVLIKRYTTDAQRKDMWGHGEKAASYQSRREVSGQNRACQQLDLGLAASRILRNEFLLCQQFVVFMAALAKTLTLVLREFEKTTADWTITANDYQPPFLLTLPPLSQDFIKNNLKKRQIVNIKSELSNLIFEELPLQDFKNKKITLCTSHFSIWYQVKLQELHCSLMRIYRRTELINYKAVGAN